jgi:hypothetical protein
MEAQLERRVADVEDGARTTLALHRVRDSMVAQIGVGVERWRLDHIAAS